MCRDVLEPWETSNRLPVVIFSQTRDAVTFPYSLSQFLMKIRCSRNPRPTPHQAANSSSLF